MGFFCNFLIFNVLNFLEMNRIVPLDLLSFEYLVDLLVAQFHGLEVDRIVGVQVDREVILVENGPVEASVALSHASLEDFETSEPSVKFLGKRELLLKLLPQCIKKLANVSREHLGGVLLLRTHLEIINGQILDLWHVLIRDSGVLLFVHPQSLLVGLQFESEYLELELLLIDQVVTDVAALKQVRGQLVELVLHTLDRFLIFQRLESSVDLHILFEDYFEAVELLRLARFLAE